MVKKQDKDSIIGLLVFIFKFLIWGLIIGLIIFFIIKPEYLGHVFAGMSAWWVRVTGGLAPGGTGNYTPPDLMTCADYDMTSEHYKMFGETNLLNIERNCLLIPGVLTKDNSEYSCYFDPIDFMVDCNSQAYKVLRDFCENTLKADYHCLPEKAYVGCECNQDLPSNHPPAQDPGDDDGWGDNENYEPITCMNIDLPDFGDMGGICSEDASCPDDGNCDHYWDYVNKEHHCGCTESTYCGQYCYTYTYQIGCECPPNSAQVWDSRSTYMCVPEGYFCWEGNPIEETGPFPD